MRAGLRSADPGRSDYGFGWPGHHIPVACGAAPQDENVIPADDLECVMEVLYDEGVDHAEGMTLFSPVGGTARSLLVVYDSASGVRYLDESTMVTDVFPLR